MNCNVSWHSVMLTAYFVLYLGSCINFSWFVRIFLVAFSCLGERKIECYDFQLI